MIRDTWWESLKNQFRNKLRERSDAEGDTQKEKVEKWTFWHEMSFMKRFVYKRGYDTFSHLIIYA